MRRICDINTFGHSMGTDKFVGWEDVRVQTFSFAILKMVMDYNNSLSADCFIWLLFIAIQKKESTYLRM